MLANGFEECQSQCAECATVPFLFRHLSHACLVSHQSFPHLWKKLWKIGEIAMTEVRTLEMSRIQTQAKVRAAVKWRFLRRQDLQPVEKQGSMAGESVSKAIFA